MRGRKAKPLSIRLAEGSRGFGPKNDMAPIDPPGKVECPSYLPAEARRVWARLVPDLEVMGLAARVRSDALACLCEAVADYSWALGVLKREGKIQKTPFGRKAHPAVKMRNDAAKRIKDFAIEFGITPSAATRIVVKKAEARPNSMAAYRLNKVG